MENDLKNSNSSDEATDTLRKFYTAAKEEHTALMSMSSKLETLYSDLSEYFVFDKQKYLLENFFEDIKQFIDKFKQVQLIFLLKWHWRFVYNQIKCQKTLQKEREELARQGKAKDVKEKSIRVCNINLNYNIDQMFIRIKPPKKQKLISMWLNQVEMKELWTT